MFENERLELEKYDIKPSKQRLIMLNFFNENEEAHHTVDEMYSYFRENKIDLSLATIYNTINVFKEKKLISAVKMHSGEYKYEKNINPHIHFECRGCNKIYNMENMDKEFEEKHAGFKVEEEQVLFKGICPDCK